MNLRMHRYPWMTDEIALFRDQVRRFAETELAPRLDDWRRQGRIDDDAWLRMGELGMMLPELPEQYGGAGASIAYQLVVLDELARVEMPMKHSVHSIVAHYILAFGTEAQRCAGCRGSRAASGWPASR